MTDSENYQIKMKINSLSNGNEHLSKLLSYCIGRLCLKAHKAGKDWKSDLNSIDALHIVDWLKAAIINDDAWLKNIDEKNRPKKLMKFGSFEDIQKEADKAMRRANQQNGDIKLIEGDEELFMKLEDGFHLVKLLTPVALKHEGVRMQHCLGLGFHRMKLHDENHKFLSFRDKYGKPHATLEIHGDSLIQFQGKQNKAPNLKYTKKLQPFIAQKKLQVDVPIRNLGYILCSKGDVYDIDNLPENLLIKGSLILYGTSIKKLPNGLKVNGNLHLKETPIEELPDHLEVGGNLYLGRTSIKSLPNNLKVGGILSLEYTPIKELPNGVEFGGDLILSETAIQKLPDGLEVNGRLCLHGTPIKSLPGNLKVDGDLNLGKTHVQKLPNNFKVGRDFYLHKTPIQELPDGLEVGGSLQLTGSNIRKLPDGLEVNGCLNISETPIKSLPNKLKVGRDFYLHKTLIQELPDDLEVGGSLQLT